MNRTPSRSATAAASSGYRVEAPRAGDAIGLALRDAYDNDLGLPDDMAALLRRLNRNGSDRITH
tara:strand:- start:2026 stop:2217 length:192 start_codon:yes stop_codon:yes gene_type:complete